MMLSMPSMLICLVAEDEHIYSIPYTGNNPDEAHAMAEMAIDNSSYIDHIVLGHDGEMTLESMLIAEKVLKHPAILSDEAWDELYNHFPKVLPER